MGTYEAWNYMCARILGGQMVPINSIGVNSLSHVVPAGDEPLKCADGESVRIIILEYFLGDLSDEHRQRDYEPTYTH